jgi:flavodoxin
MRKDNKNNMNIAIVIHTGGGHTLKFAQAIRDKLVASGHEVDLTGLRTIGTVTAGFLPLARVNFTIKNPPELEEFDTVLVGGPVWWFKASPVIMRYLIEDVQNLKGKRALSFATMGGLGGVRALRMMDGELEAAGAEVLDGEAVKYFIKPKEPDFSAAVDRICGRVCGR